MSDPTPIASFFCGCCLGTEHVSLCERGHARVACCHRLKELEAPCPGCLTDAAEKAKLAAEKAKIAAEKAAEKAVAAEQAARDIAEKAAGEKRIAELEQALKDAKASQEQK